MPELSIFQKERNAYQRLNERGLCARGVVPKFYGTIENIQLEHWTPHLDMFLQENELPPHAILIEYIPNLCEIDLSNYSKDRMDRLLTYLRDFHEVDVLHGDMFPRNMMVIPGNPDRVLWIDFDRAAVCPRPFSQRQLQNFDFETAIVQQCATEIVSDDTMHHARFYSDR